MATETLKNNSAVKEAILYAAKVIKKMSTFPGFSPEKAVETYMTIIEKAAIESHPWCSVCGTKGTKSNPLTLDHIKPKAQRGSSKPDNLRVVCLHHNDEKSGRDRAGAAKMR